MAELAGIEGARERGRTRGWVLSALRPHTKAVSAALALTLLASLLAVAQPVALKRLVEALGASGRALGPLGLLVGVTLAEATCRGLVVYLVQSTSEHVTRDLRIDLVRHVLRLPIRRLDAARRGDLVTRLTADSAQVRLVLTSGLLEMTSATMLIIGSVIVMTLLDTVLAGVTMGAIVLVVVILTPVAGKLRKANSHYQESLGSLGGGLDTVLSSIRLLRSYSAERSQGDVLAQAAQTTWRHGLRVARLAALIEPVVAVATQGALLTVLVVGGARVSRGQLTLGDLVAFLLYLFMVLLPLAQLVNALARLQAGLAALARIGQIVDTPLEPNPGAGTPATRWETPVVELEGVSFEYEPGIGVFDLSFAANKGTHTAIVGPSGAGKSTVLGLIQQFYPVHQGHLRFNGTPADTTDVMHCRGLTHFVEQNTPALATTIRDNLLLANPNATEAHLRTAMRRVGLGHLLVRDRVLDCPLGDNGLALSGGERQRLAWARLLVSERDLVLLDEPTSNVDPANEALFGRLVRELSDRHAVITVAHRLSTVRAADQVLVLDAGRIVGAGTHEELARSCGLYQELLGNLT